MFLLNESITRRLKGYSKYTNNKDNKDYKILNIYIKKLWQKSRVIERTGMAM